MFITFSPCEICGKMIEGRDCLPVVDAECTGCGTRVRACPTCKRRGCPVCGGSLKNTWVPLAEKKVLVGQVMKGTKCKRRG